MTTPLRKRGEIEGQGQGEGKGKREGKGETVSSEFHDEGGFHTHTSFCQHLYNIYRLLIEFLKRFIDFVLLFETFHRI